MQASVQGRMVLDKVEDHAPRQSWIDLSTYCTNDFSLRLLPNASGMGTPLWEKFQGRRRYSHAEEIPCFAETGCAWSLQEEMAIYVRICRIWVCECIYRPQYLDVHSTGMLFYVNFVQNFETTQVYYYSQCNPVSQRDWTHLLFSSEIFSIACDATDLELTRLEL